MKEYLMVLRVGMSTEGLEPHLAANGDIVGFKMKDGSIIRPILAFEEDTKGKGETFRDHTGSTKLEKLGIVYHDYSDIQFLELGEDSDEGVG